MSCVPEKRASSLSVATVKGMAFLGAESVLARIILFASQIALGWLLLPEHFGISALAGTVSAIAWTIVGFGVDDVLLQRGKSIPKWERTVFALSILMAAITALVVLAISPWVAVMFGEPDIVGLLALTALGIFISAFSTVSMVKVKAALDFKWLAGINILNAALAQGLTILFALLGFGAYSFFLPIPILQGVRTLLFLRRQPPLLIGRFRRKQIWLAASGGVRVFAARLAEAIMAQADYFVLGFFVVTNVVGYYTFAFRLAATPVRMLGNSLRSVLVPTLVHMKGDDERQKRTALEASEMLAYIVAPMCLFQSALAEPVLLFVFGQKWASAVPIMQVLSIGLSAEALLSVARARMSALGQFTRAMKYAFVGAAIFIAYTVAGAFLGREMGVAIAVAAYALTVTPVIFFRVFETGPALGQQVLRIFVRPLLVAAIASFTGHYTSQVLLPDGRHIAAIAIISAVGMVTYGALVAVTNPRITKRMIGLARSATGKISNG